MRKFRICGYEKPEMYEGLDLSSKIRKELIKLYEKEKWFWSKVRKNESQNAFISVEMKDKMDYEQGGINAS